MIAGVADLHVHGAPSLMPRHGPDHEVVRDHALAGVSFAVLKAHEGSTMERAALAAARSATDGVEVVGGIVLNSPVGGANPDAASVAAQLGGRVVWMPTCPHPRIGRRARAASWPCTATWRSARCRCSTTPGRCSPRGTTCSTWSPSTTWCSRPGTSPAPRR